MSRGVTLLREEVSRQYIANRGDAFRLRISVTAAENMPTHIFGHQQTLVDPHTAQTQDEFCFVISPYDASIYPEEEPAADQFPAFFRKDSLDVVLASSDMADEMWEAIKAEVCELVAAYNRLDVLTEVEEYTCGEIPSSVSESSSGSG